MNFLIIDPVSHERAAVAKYAKTSFGWSCMEFDDGRDALQHLKQHPVDLVVLELALPVLDGCEIIQRIRKMPRQSETRLRIVVHTARSDAQSRRTAFEAGCDELVIKNGEDIFGALRAHALRMTPASPPRGRVRAKAASEASES